MATIINNPSTTHRADEADGASDLVIGIIALVSIIILILFLVYGLPVLQSTTPASVNTPVTPSTQNIRVELPSQAQTQTPAANQSPQTQTPASQSQGGTNF